MPETPYTPDDADRAAGRIAEGAIHDLDLELQRRNLLPVLGEARLVIAAFFAHVALQGQNYVASIIAQGHDIAPFLRSQHPKKEEPPPSPL